MRYGFGGFRREALSRRARAVPSRGGFPRAGPRESNTATQKRAQKTATAKAKGGKTRVTLKGRLAKVKSAKPMQARGAAASGGKGGAATMPKTFSIDPAKTSRPVSIKDFTLPAGTKMTISFVKKGGAAAGAKGPAKRVQPSSKPKRKQTTKVVVAKRGNVGRKQTAAKGGRANPKARNSKKRN